MHTIHQMSKDEDAQSCYILIPKNQFLTPTDAGSDTEVFNSALLKMEDSVGFKP